MQKIFNNILMPLRLNSQTDQAVMKAIHFANQMDCHLHLLFIIKTSFFFPGNKQKHEAEQKMKIHAMGEKYYKQLKKELKLFIISQKGSIENLVPKYSEIHNIDMILAGGGVKHLGFLAGNIPADGMINTIKCPVLTISSYPAIQSFRTIILPIGSVLPINQIRIALYLAKHFDAAIHLVTMEKNDAGNEDLVHMKRAFNVLKNNTDLPIVCSAIAGKTLEEAAIEYTHTVTDGLVMMNPGTRSSIRGFLNKLFAGTVNEELKVPVIMVG